MEAEETLTHQELVKVTSSVVNELLQNDPYLADLPMDVTLHEVESLTELLHGKSIKVNLERNQNILPVIVPQRGCQVHELKRAIKRCIELEQKRNEAHPKRISWKSVWRRYSLLCNGELITKDTRGFPHNSTIAFVKKNKVT